MIQYTKEHLQKILKDHLKWLNDEDGGARADLSRANLSWANLSRADLSRADLSWANLSRANLSGADLSRANLSRANLSGADLSGADLSWANLSRANLSGADLSRANLSGADLSRAKNVNEARWNELTAFFGLSCPETGAFIGWKKAEHMIVKLRITEDAKRSSATSRKCRCSKAEVLAIENLDGSDPGVGCVASDHDRSFMYAIGQTVEVTDFDDDRWNECSRGIHFFVTRQEAVKY